MKTKFAPATIQIGRHFGSDEKRCVTIEVTDKISGAQFVEVKLSLAEFADAVFGRGYVPCEFNLRGVDKVGMKAENKEEFVPISREDDRKENYSKALKPFEVDGWHARSGDMGNGHRREGDGYRVVFFRHVPAE